MVANFHSHTDPTINPFPQPIELQSSISAEEWQDRTVSIWKHFARYSWSRFLRAYLMISLVLSLIGPILANLIINRTMFNGVEPLKFSASDEEIRERLSLIRKGHLINFIVICLMFLIIWVPYLSYKSLGRKRLATLLQSFNKVDAAKGNMQALSWSCSRTSTFQSNATIVIELPIAFLSASKPSAFQQGAYLPNYIQKDPTVVVPPNYGYPADEKASGLNGGPRLDNDHAQKKA